MEKVISYREGKKVIEIGLREGIATILKVERKRGKEESQLINLTLEEFEIVRDAVEDLRSSEICDPSERMREETGV